MKTCIIPMALLALVACHEGEAADQRYQKQVAKMACGDAAYALTSTCIKSEDPFELNQCQPQSLVTDVGGAKRSAALPELPSAERKRVQAIGGDLKRLFVVRWACSNSSIGPIATLHYSIGGGSAEYSETWSHYDRTGKLIEGSVKLTPVELSAVERNFKNVPSIMPD